MLAALYTYGHLFTASLSAAIALAFLTLGLRIPEFRTDRWHALVFALMSGASVTELVIALQPSSFWMRLYYQILAMMFLAIAVAIHRQFCEPILDARERRPYERGLRGYALLCVVLLVLAGSGLGDHGTRLEIVWGVRMSVIDATGWMALLCFAYTTAILPLTVPLLLRGGSRLHVRRAIVVAMFLSPLVVARECLIAVRAWHGLPMGGYVAGLLGVNGLFILLERLGDLTDQRTVELGGYRLGERLGAGGMAEVFVAEKRGAGELSGVVQRVAIKRMRPEHAGDPNFAQMFLDEARLAARLHHPHIVTLHDVGITEGEAYLAMELVEGAALSSLLRARGAGLSPHVVVELGVQMSDALAYAHQLTDSSTGRPLGLVHRDVSPQNILVARTGVAKLTDFGIARADGRSTMTATGVLKGKVTYMAPEQMRGESFDHRADLWALGVVLYEAATGARLYEGLSEPQIIGLAWQKQRPPLDALEALPEGLGHVIRSLLEPDPHRRPLDAEILYRTLLPLRDEARARDELGALAAQAADTTPRRHEDDPDARTVAESPHARVV